MIGKSIESTDELATTSPVQPRQHKKAPGSKGIGFALFIASIALFFTAVGIAAGYKHWQRMHDRAKDNARRIVVLESALARKMDTQDLAVMMTLPITDPTRVSETINQLLIQLPPRVAVPPLRLGVASDDEAMQEDISNTVLVNAEGELTADKKVGWSAYKQRVLTLLDTFVAVRKVEPSVDPVLRAEAREAAHSLIQLQLESLRLMALKGNKRAYQQQIELVRKTVNEYTTYYAPERMTSCQALVNELASIELQTTTLSPAFNSLNTLNQNQQSSSHGVEQ